MKNVYEVLRQKELELSRLEIEVEALRVAAPLLAVDSESGDDNKPASAHSIVPAQPVRKPQAINPPPTQPGEKDKDRGWP